MASHTLVSKNQFSNGETVSLENSQPAIFLVSLPCSVTDVYGYSQASHLAFLYFTFAICTVSANKHFTRIF